MNKVRGKIPFLPKVHFVFFCYIEPLSLNKASYDYYMISRIMLIPNLRNHDIPLNFFYFFLAIGKKQPS